MIFNPKLNGFLSDQNSSILHVFFVETYTTVKSDEVNTAKVPRFQTDQICGFKLAPDFSHVKNTKKKKGQGQVSLHFLIDAIIFPVMTQLKPCISDVYEYGIDLKINSPWTSWETAKHVWKGRPFQEEIWSKPSRDDYGTGFGNTQQYSYVIANCEDCVLDL